MRFAGLCDMLRMGLSCAEATERLEEAGPYVCPPTSVTDCSVEWATMALLLVAGLVWGMVWWARRGETPRAVSARPRQTWRSRLPVRRRNGKIGGVILIFN